MMKKLLLVMLVPVLVFGFLGCGSKFEEGEPIPYFAQGEYKGVSYGSNEYIRLIITPTQLVVFRLNEAGATVGTSAYRLGADFSFGDAIVSEEYQTVGIVDPADVAFADLTEDDINPQQVLLYGFDGGGEIGALGFYYIGNAYSSNGNNDFVVTFATVGETYAQTYQVPVAGVYRRLQAQ